MRTILLLAGAIAACAQPAFEVASVKPQAWTGQGSVGIGVRGNTLDCEHVGLNDLVLFAYNLRSVQLSGGPAWGVRGELAGSELYQVIAKASGDTPPSMDQFRSMLQTLLADRFQLQVHHAQKDLPVFNLVVTKGGPKLKESSTAVKPSTNVYAKGRTAIRIDAKGMTMQNLVDSQLSGYAGRPVFDKTGLPGSYDLMLEFVVDNLAATASNSGDPALATALQEQLGLKLESATAPFDTVVIDRAERPPAN